MRDLVPRNQSASSGLVTPWSTYIGASSFTHQTPTKPITKKRTSVSPSPVAHSKEPVPPSPFVFSPVDEEDRQTPSIIEFPHESIQLPKRAGSSQKREGASKKSPMDIIEEFISTLSLEEKEAVRATYNGPDWFKPKPKLPITKDGNRMTLASSQHYQFIPPHPQTFSSYPIYQPPPNRFLASLPMALSPQVIYPPQVHYFPRGC
jgi:hypothetical protein